MDLPNKKNNSAQLILPQNTLASCLAAGIIRDTRNLNLSPDQRFNYFPASPLCAITWTFEGQCYLSDRVDQQSTNNRLMSQTFISGPQTKPIISYNPNHVYAMTIGIYPDAFQHITGSTISDLIDRSVAVDTILKGNLLTLCQSVMEANNAQKAFQLFEAGLQPLWQDARPTKSAANWLSDWTYSLAARALNSSPGKSVRQVQRRIKSWTGQNQRDLMAYARNEKLFANLRASNSTADVNLASLALETGFSDQSHMGRQVRKITGVSPAKLNRLIATKEEFWCYRLLGKRY